MKTSLLLRLVVTSVLLSLCAAISARAEGQGTNACWPKSADEAVKLLSGRPAEQATADDWARRAWALSRYRSDHVAAAEAAAKALTLDADHYRAHEIAGIAAQTAGRYEEAFEHYLRLVSAGRPESQLYIAVTDSLNLTRSQRERLLAEMRKAVADQRVDPVYKAALQWRITGVLISQGELESSARERAKLQMLTDWMVIGPFSNEENAGFAKEYEPESEIDYSKKYQGRDREVSWERLRHVDPAGGIDFDAVMYPNNQVLAYALTFLHAPEAADAVLRFGAGNAVKVWLNDQLLLSNDEDVAFGFDQYEVPVRLRAGWNKLLFKVCERHDQWQLAVRLTSAGGEPLAAQTDAVKDKPLEIRQTPAGEGKADFEYVRGLHGHFLKLREADPDDPAAAYYLGRAEGLTNRKMRAVGTFEKLVALNGKCSDHYALLAKSYLADERPEKALVAMKEVLSLEPDHVECLGELGRFYDNRNLFEKALATLRKAAELNPDWPDAQYYLAGLYGDKEWEEEAWRRAEWLLEKKPDVPWVLENYAEKCRSRGYREKAKEYYEKLLAENYADGNARQALISQAVDERRIEDALEQYHVLLKLHPLSAGIRLAKARLLMESKRHDEALAECKEALDICPANFRVYKLMGALQQRMGQDEQAMETWRTALLYYPDDKWIREYLEFLQPESIASFDRYGVSDEDAAEIVKNRAKPSDYPKADSVRLLDHLVVEMNDDGSYTALRHQIVQILNDSGRDRYTTMSAGGYNPRIKRAVVIQRDGSEVEASEVNGGIVKFGQLQAGSIIELKAQHRGSSNEWLSRHYTQTFLFQAMAPARRAEYVLLVPKSRTIRHAIAGDRVKLAKGEFEAHVVYDFRADDEPMLEPEINRPPPVDVADLVRVSTIESWDEIARWEYSLVKDQFVADDAVRAKVAELTAGADGRAAKIRALANFVMQKVQYRQDYDRGIMGIKPHKAGSVLEKEAGDCKDKATLLITMLREAGIPADYVTLRTRTAGRMWQDIPSNQCDHAIVYVPDEGNAEEGLWIDGTANYSGIDTLPWQDQGAQVMVFKDDGTMAFKTTPVDPAARSTNEYDVDMQLAADGSAKVKMTWRAAGQFGSNLRRAFEAEGIRRQQLERFANAAYPGSRVESVDFSDLENRDAPVAIDFAFEAPNIGQITGGKMVLRLKELLPLTQSYADRTERTFNIWVPFTATQRISEKFHAPEGFKVDSAPAPLRLENEWMDYELQVETQGDLVTVHREFAIKALEIPRDAYDKIRDFCVEADNRQRQPVILAPRAGSAERSAESEGTMPAPSRQ
jgi:tetratricopeptide (TPR) repeat protein/predicted transglutaminase-like cysteine proteinase